MPNITFCGASLKQVNCFKYLGIMVDDRLSWQPHVEDVCTRALCRLQQVQKISGNFWGAHPRIIHRLVHGAVLPLLYYASPVWVGILSSLSKFLSIERVLRLAGIAICGLLRTASGEAAMLISGILPPEIELRQRLAQFWLRTLATGSYINMEPTQGAVASFCSPQDILNAEIRALSRDRIFKEITTGGARVEREVPNAFQALENEAAH